MTEYDLDRGGYPSPSLLPPGVRGETRGTCLDPCRNLSICACSRSLSFWIATLAERSSWCLRIPLGIHLDPLLPASDSASPARSISVLRLTPRSRSLGEGVPGGMGDGSRYVGVRRTLWRTESYVSVTSPPSLPPRRRLSVELPS
jgi:hypothetical protein